MCTTTYLLLRCGERRVFGELQVRRAVGCAAQVVQPRRIAAKAAARRMAALLREPVGARIGYVTRLERRVSARTRVEVVTTGVLLRRLQSVRARWLAHSLAQPLTLLINTVHLAIEREPATHLMLRSWYLSVVMFLWGIALLWRQGGALICALCLFRTRRCRAWPPSSWTSSMSAAGMLTWRSPFASTHGAAPIPTSGLFTSKWQKDACLEWFWDSVFKTRYSHRLVVMSATLAGDLAERLQAIMSPVQPPLRPAPRLPTGSGVALLSCEGRSFPVRNKYLGAPGKGTHFAFACPQGVEWYAVENVAGMRV